MRAFDSLSRLLAWAALALIVAATVGIRDARAGDAVDDLADVLDYAGYVPGWPIKGQDVRDSRKLFECVDSAKDDVGAATCVDSYLNTPVGKKAAAEGGLPSWFKELLEAYIDIRTKDWWGLAENLGMTIACAAAQVLAGGTDICGIVKWVADAIGWAKGAYDDVVAFLEDLGCTIGVSDCGKPTPKYVLAYRYVFEPLVDDGFKARKGLASTAFETLRQNLSANALHKPNAKLSVPLQFSFSFDQDDVKKAAETFTSTVDKKWTEDLLNNVMPELFKKRLAYNTPEQVAKVAAAAEAAFDANPLIVDAKKAAIDACVADFAKLGFAHVDMWMQLYPGQAKGVQSLKSNNDWCHIEFISKNHDKFAQHFRSFVQAKYCPAHGQKLACQKLASFDRCYSLMGSIGESKQCGVDAATIGKEAAPMIAEAFQKGGSKIKCNIVAEGLPFSGTPVVYLCSRPTQGHACGEIYQKLFAKLPDKVVACVVFKDGAYKALEAKVTQAVAALSSKYQFPLGIDKIDPLVVHATKPEVFAKVSGGEKLTDFAFGPPSSKPGFDFPLMVMTSIDGVSTPVITGDLKYSNPAVNIQQSVAGNIQLVKPGDPDPYGKLGNSALKPGVADAAPGVVAAVGAVAAQGAAVAGQQSKVLSGPAPAASGPRDEPPPTDRRREVGRQNSNDSRLQSALPAVQSPMVGSVNVTPPAQRSQLPAVQTQVATSTQLPTGQASTRSQLPAVQSPGSAARSPTPAGSTPNWGGIGRESGPPPTPQMPAPGTAPLANAAPAVIDATTERALAAASCARTPGVGGLRFSCATRAGFDRCDALRRQNKVEQCTLGERR